MPAGIKDAFKSPFHSMYPSSQFHDISSYTRSSGTESIHNEAVQAHMNRDFNTNYRLDDSDSSHLSHSSPLPKYTPSMRETTDEDDSDSESDLIEFRPKRTNGTKDPKGPKNAHKETTKTFCDDLIHQVLTNKKCRQILKRILLEDDNDNDNDNDNGPTIKNTRVSKGFTNPIQHVDSDTVKNILIYSTGGLLLLCVLDLLFKMGQLLK
jgi:hypothetical protein